MNHEYMQRILAEYMDYFIVAYYLFNKCITLKHWIFSYIPIKPFSSNGLIEIQLVENLPSQ